MARIRSTYFLLSIVFMAKLSFAQARTVTSALTRMGIALDHTSLCRALRDPRPGVRSLAAAELAEQKDRTALPEIQAAYDRERDPGALYGLALSLDQFGVAEGKKRLEDFCADAASDVGTRTMAANALVTLNHDYACAPYMLQCVVSDDAGIRESALFYVSNVPASQKNLAAFGPPLLAVALNDSNSFFRKLAAKALMQLGDEGSKQAYLAAHPPDSKQEPDR